MRPEWFDQLACLRSFIAAAEHARARGLVCRATAVVDGQVSGALQRELEWFDDVDAVQLFGNSRAFRHALDLAIGTSTDVTLFAEDDYLWLVEAVLETVMVLQAEPRVRYASPYAHPAVTDLSQRDVRRHRRVVIRRGGVSWRSTPRTTMTFACRTAALEEDRHHWWLASYGASPKDGYAFWALLEDRWFHLVGNAAFRDIRRVLDLRTARLVLSSAARRVRRERRALLMQPEDGLATHVHEPYITGSADWSALSAALVEATPVDGFET